MPTATAPMTENVICHASDGMRCFTMPWVAWKPAIAAGATKAAARLSALGFRVKEMLGGIEYWRKEGFEVEGTKGTEAPLVG